MTVSCVSYPYKISHARPTGTSMTASVATMTSDSSHTFAAESVTVVRESGGRVKNSVL